MPEAVAAAEALTATGRTITHEEIRGEFRRWLLNAKPDLPAPPAHGASFGERLTAVCALQGILHDAGWARLGWPEELGGLGGDLTASRRAL